MVYLLKLAIFMQETGIGDSVMAGLASSSTTCVALIVSLVFMLIFRALKRYTVLVSMASIALAFTLLATATSMIGVFAGAIVYGVYLGTIIPYLQTTLSGLVSPLPPNVCPFGAVYGDVRRTGMLFYVRTSGRERDRYKHGGHVRGHVGYIHCFVRHRARLPGGNEEERGVPV